MTESHATPVPTGEQVAPDLAGHGRLVRPAASLADPALAVRSGPGLPGRHLPGGGRDAAGRLVPPRRRVNLRNFGLSSAANGGIASSGIFEARHVADALAYARNRPDTRGMATGLFSRCLDCSQWCEQVLEPTVAS